MSLSSNFPTSKPSLNLDFANVGALDPRITFTRSSSATYTNSLGLITTAATNVARFDYDPVTLAARGLLVEEQRTNLLTYSEQFDNAAWTTKQNCTITANAGTAPDGTQNADLMLVTNTSAPLFFRTVALSSSTYSTTVYAKATSSTINNKISIGTLDGNNDAATFDLTTGTVSSVYSGHAASMALQNNGWYRCQVNHPTFSGTAYPLIAVNSPTVDAAIGPLLWGYQLEAGSFATSYIPTVASTVTRNTDLASINTLSPWYQGGTAETWFAEIIYPRLINGTRFVATEAAATPYNTPLFNSGSTLAMFDGTATRNFGTMSGSSSAQKIAVAYSGTTASGAVNGSVATGSFDGSMDSPTIVYLGGYSFGSYINGHLRRIAYYPRRLSDAELAALTA